MKVSLLYTSGDMPIQGYNCEDKTFIDEIDETNKSILKKVQEVVIDFPVTPTKDMRIDLYGFKEVYKFSEIEMDYLEDGARFLYIHEVWINPTYLELFVSVKKELF